MTDPDTYFARAEGTPTSKGRFITVADDTPAVEMVKGLVFNPVVGDSVMANFVRFEPHTEAPVHWHDEEQISYVIDGELEFEVAGEQRLLRRGEAVVIPPNVPHGARTHDGSCLEVDVFHPPRRALLETLGRDEPDAG